MIGQYAPDFELPGIDGEVYHLTRYREQLKGVGVVFMCNHCPFVRLYLERLKQIQAEFGQQGFTLMGINANDAAQVPEDSFEHMKQFAAQQGLNFPYLRDPSQDVALAFGATKTPEVFLVDAAGRIRYQGAIDNYAESAEKVTEAYLRENIQHLLRGEAIAPEFTEAMGCSLKWREV
ncbi:thioredoxin family protein [Spirulina subsalsa FACHB-351]|uniref:Thioredoxin family protein n=2 Tax=Spirulina subsalsa TaxID=54311 RepID=A0ABT3L9Y0_9CYAN|nr:thioredoxin family protein [Spirulina subsalsa FACHB-351]